MRAKAGKPAAQMTRARDVAAVSALVKAPRSNSTRMMSEERTPAPAAAYLPTPAARSKVEGKFNPYRDILKKAAAYFAKESI
ncbi:MAG: hypothetical protein AMXMBFR74_05870 [Parvibaculum sp.]